MIVEDIIIVNDMKVVQSGGIKMFTKIIICLPMRVNIQKNLGSIPTHLELSKRIRKGAQKYEIWHLLH